MYEWIDLYYKKIPEDILAADYKFQVLEKVGPETFIGTGFEWRDTSLDVVTILANCQCGKYRYCKLEFKQPSHKELALDYAECKYPSTLGHSSLIKVMFEGFRVVATDAFIAGRESVES